MAGRVVTGVAVVIPSEADVVVVVVVVVEVVVDPPEVDVVGRSVAMPVHISEYAGQVMLPIQPEGAETVPALPSEGQLTTVESDSVMEMDELAELQVMDMQRPLQPGAEAEDPLFLKSGATKHLELLPKTKPSSLSIVDG